MLLRDTQSGELVEVESLQELINPRQRNIAARVQAGQEEQAAERLGKEHLAFPSGESLPRCWTDPNYRHAEAAAASH